MFHVAPDMSQNRNGNGHGNSMAALKPKLTKRATASAPLPPSEAASTFRENGVLFKTSEGVALRGATARIHRHAVVFELYSPIAMPRLSEALTDFKIILQEREIYSGRAVISNIVDAGTRIVCEATLEAIDWVDLNLIIALEGERGLTHEFKAFMDERQKNYALSPEFKVAVADLQMLLHDLRLWMGHIELKLQAQADAMRRKFERNVLETLLPLVLPVLGSLFERFEKTLPPSEKPFDGAYALYAKRLLHQLVLGAPFMRRTFEKPLGYAGDYEMVAMMVRDPFEGDSLFAKILNTFFIETPPVVAHRNRIDVLTERLKQEVSARSIKGRQTRIFNLGCGPAIEIQRFLANFRFSDNADFMLLDFNDETVEFARKTLEKIAAQHNRDCMIRVIKKSVAQLLKDNSQFQRDHYDLVYCAGLFDYLADPVCRQLVEIFYELVAPGGLVLITNVHVNNPSRGWMEYMVDWHLEYRDTEQMAAILPTRGISEEQTRIFIEPSGVNIFAEIRKP